MTIGTPRQLGVDNTPVKSAAISKLNTPPFGDNIRSVRALFATQPSDTGEIVGGKGEDILAKWDDRTSFSGRQNKRELFPRHEGCGITDAHRESHPTNLTASKLELPSVQQ
jgi:hypothetical protein